MSNYSNYRCSSCGAIMSLDNEYLKKCIYCGSIEIIKETLDSQTLVDGIIPVKNDEKSLKKIIKSIIYNKKLFPSNKENLVKIKNLILEYVPLFVFDFGVSAYGFNSNKTELKYSEILRVCVDGNIQIKDTYINNISPFNLANIKEFNPSYFTSVMHANFDDTINVERIEEPIKDFIRHQIKTRENLPGANIRNSLRGKETSSKVESTIVKIDEMKIYVPVWYAKIELEDESYEVIVNDTNGNNYIFNYHSSNINKKSLIKLSMEHPKAAISILIFLLLFIIYIVEGEIPEIFVCNILILAFFISLVTQKEVREMYFNSYESKNTTKETLNGYSNVELINCNVEYDRKVNYFTNNEEEKFIFK